MNELVIGSTFEISLRILLILNELSPLSLDKQQIEMIDFISVYAADFGLLDENLHGYNNYRYSEYPARKRLVTTALNNLILNGYVQLYLSSSGYCYNILEAGKVLCQAFTSSYAKEYVIAVQAVVNKFGNANTESMLKEINRRTLQSLKEVVHE